MSPLRLEKRFSLTENFEKTRIGKKVHENYFQYLLLKTTSPISSQKLPKIDQGFGFEKFRNKVA